MGNIQAIEILYTAIALFGLVFATINYRRSRATKQYLLETGITNGRARLAHYSAQGELLRVIKQAIFFSIGVVSFLIPPASLGEIPVKYQVSAQLIRWGLVAATTLVSFQSFNHWRFQREFKLERSDPRD